MQILVHRRNGGLGDVVCMLPAIDALRAKFPAAQLDVALPVEYAGLLRSRLSGVRVIAFDYSKFRPRWRCLFRAGYDLTFDLSGPNVPPDGKEPNRIDWFAEVCGVSQQTAAHPVPAYRVLPAEREWAKAWLASRGIEPGSRPLVCLHLKSACARKDWPIDRMRELAGRLVGRGVQIVGLERSAALSVSGAADAVGLDMAQAAALIAASDLLVGPDSGPMHLAAAVGIPCVALFGPTDPDVILKYYGATHHAIRRPSVAAIAVDDVIEPDRRTQSGRGRRVFARGCIAQGVLV